MRLGHGVMSNEIWREVPGYEGWYEASSDGRVRSVERVISVVTCRAKPYTIKCKSKVLRPGLSNGYRQVTLWQQNVKRIVKVATIIAETFIGPRPEGMYVCHENGNRADDRVVNLYYGTPTQNSEDKRRHGTHIEGEGIPWSKLTKDDVRYIRAKRGIISQKSLAAKFGVGQGHISRVQLGHEWAHVR